MQALLATLAERLLVTAALTLLLMAGLLRLLQGGALADTGRGIARLLLLALRAPVDYSRDVLDDATRGAEVGRQGRRGDPQMLMHRGLAILRFGVVAGGLGLVSAGVAAGWDAMVPPREAVTAYRSAVRERRALSAALPALRDILTRRDTDWARDSAGFIRSFTDTLRRRIARAEATRGAVRADLTERPGPAGRQFLTTLDDLDGYRPGWSDEQLIASYHQRVNALFASLRPLDDETLRSLGFTGRDSLLLIQYLNAWSTQRADQRTLARWGPEAARDMMQPDYRARLIDRDTSVQRLAVVEGELPALRAQSRWQPLRLVLSTALATWSAFVFTWSGGLLTELLRLLLDLAVGALRRLAAERG